MSEQTTPVNASDVVILDLKNLSGAIQFRVNINGELQWKLLTDSTWFTITSLELLRGRSLTNVAVNAQNQFVLSFSDLTTQTLSIAALGDAITRATAAATQALASAGAAVAVAQGTATANPTILPTHIFNFASTKTLPSNFSFTRGSTASYVDKYGNIKYVGTNEPRFTHDFNSGESLGILIEESRTNLVKNSALIGATVGVLGTATGVVQQFAGTNNTSTTTNYSVQRGLEIVTIRSVGVANNNHLLLLQPTGGNTVAVSGKRYTLSLYINTYGKTAGLEISYLKADGSLISMATTSLNTFSTTSLERKVITLLEDAPANCTQIRWWITFGGGVVGTSFDFSFQYGGCQVEEGQCETSYIPTVGASITRSPDSLSFSSSIISKIEGTLLVRGVKAGNYENTQKFYRMVIGGASGYDLLGITGANNSITSWDGVASISSNPSTFDDSMALSYNKTQRKLGANGAISTGTFDVTSLNSDRFYIGSKGGNTNFLNGTINSIRFFSKMVSDVELVELTSKKLFGSKPNASPVNANLNELAYMDKATLLSLPSYNEFVLNGTGASLSMIIRRPYAFTFVLVESSSATFTSTPPASCSANTDYTIAFTAPVGKQLVYAICPIFDI